MALAALLLSAAGCRQDMHDQAKYEPLEKSAFYADGMSSRPLIPHTVPRGFLREDTGFFTGLDAAAKPVAAFPLETLRGSFPGGAELSDVELRREILKRGEQRFETFCTPCHGWVGSGDGMIVQRGFQVPPSFHEERLRNSPPGHFVNVMTEGFGQMSSYAAQIRPEDRWAVAAYVKALQLSQHARLAELPAQVAHSFEEAQHKAPTGEGEARHGASAQNEAAAHGADHSGEK
ncbi:MAG: cytochrome c [Acidobacteria bacterium]|nr:cytochrome c [Acidobacteriota bacterium]